MKYTVTDTDLGITIARFATPAEAKGFITRYGQLGTGSDMLSITLDK